MWSWKIEKALCMFFFIFLPYHTTHNHTRSYFATRRAWSSHIIQSLTYSLARSLNWSQFQLHYFRFYLQISMAVVECVNFKLIEFTCGVEGKNFILAPCHLRQKKIFAKTSSKKLFRKNKSVLLTKLIRGSERERERATQSWSNGNLFSDGSECFFEATRGCWTLKLEVRARERLWAVQNKNNMKKKLKIKPATTTKTKKKLYREIIVCILLRMVQSTTQKVPFGCSNSK